LESAVFPRARAGLLSGGESVYQRGNEGKTQPVFSAKTAPYGVVAVFSVILIERPPAKADGIGGRTESPYTG